MWRLRRHAIECLVATTGVWHFRTFYCFVDFEQTMLHSNTFKRWSAEETLDCRCSRSVV